MQEFEHFLPEMAIARRDAAARKRNAQLPPHQQQQFPNYPNQHYPLSHYPQYSAFPQYPQQQAQPQPTAKQTAKLKRQNEKQNGGAGRGSKKARVDNNGPSEPKSKHGHVGAPLSTNYTPIEEFEFFDKVRKLISNKQVYQEFLKVLNLYSQDIIDRKTLVERVHLFIGKSHDLFSWFKKFVDYEEKQQLDASETIETPQLDYNMLKKHGVSYRKLPKNMPRPVCSGRDDLCREVLNDDWVSHPTWASEDGGFISHKKNLFEEALYRCEEERYEFDMNIKALQSVIVKLDNVAYHISQMSVDEARRYKLGKSLNMEGSDVIYKRVIKKVYDSDRGQEVIDSLLNHPAVSVNLILKRLQQKDEEWRRDQVICF